MTTAHRPTWKAAVGKANEGGWTAGGAISTQKSALDAPAQLSLKLRATPVDKNKALKESLLALEQAESGASKKKHAVPPPRPPVDPEQEERAQQRLLKQTAEVDISRLKEKYSDSDVDEGDDDNPSSSSESDLDDENDDDSDEGDSDEDDEEALQAELAKIRAEREEARRKEQEQAEKEEQAEQEESALLGNPLLAGGVVGGGADVSGGSKRRRWNDDVVFRNQAKGEPKPKKRFINDTVRNDFHKRFLNKFIR